MKLSGLLLLCVAIHSYDDTLEDFRKHYGLSYYHNCREYEKIFKCLTACKSIGFQVFRMDRRCKCTCHVMKTTTPVPYFKWRTNGTTREIPKTFSPQLYHIVGTLSPPPTTTPKPTNATRTCPVDDDERATEGLEGNGTDTDSIMNTTIAENSTIAEGNATTEGVSASDASLADTNVTTVQEEGGGEDKDKDKDKDADADKDTEKDKDTEDNDKDQVTEEGN